MVGAASPASIVASCRAKLAAAKAGDWPGPMWLNDRVTTAGMPCSRHAAIAIISCASLLVPYGVFGARGESSVSGAADAL